MDMQNVSNLQIPEGAVRTIHDKDNRLIWGRLAYDTKYVGDTTQNGTPTPDAPVSINVVTGEQTVTISDGVDSEDFTISLGSTELAKIGTYQDYIYKSSDDWYVHKATGKYTFTGNETFNYQSAYTGFTINSANVPIYMPDIKVPMDGYSNYFIVEKTTTTWTGNNRIGLSSNGTFWAKSTAFGTTQQTCETWLSTNTPIVRYVLNTATDTQITDTTLISQLDAIHEWLTRYGYNATVSGNLPMIIDRTNL